MSCPNAPLLLCPRCMTPIIEMDFWSPVALGDLTFCDKECVNLWLADRPTVVHFPDDPSYIHDRTSIEFPVG